MSKANAKVKTATRRGKTSRRTQAEEHGNVIDFAARSEGPIEKKGLKTRLECLREVQAHYLTSIESKILTVGEGPAGTGKSYVATSKAALWLRERRIHRLVITRPIVGAQGEGLGLGFLPGTIQEKCQPYFEPIRQILLDWFGESELELMIKRGKIEFIPIDFIRGHTFDNTFILVDEAQNSTPAQMKLLLTRVGKNSTIVVDGDSDQKDIRGLSGLEDIKRRFGDMEDVGIIEFTEDDIVRSGFAREVLKRYRKK